MIGKLNVPKVSIILVNYSGYKDTFECIDSLRQIDYENYEIIIVDNCSPDDSVKKIKGYLNSKEHLICSEINGGFSYGNNLGIKTALESGSKYILLLNNDTIVEPKFLQHLVNVLEVNKQAGMAIGKILYESKRDTIWYAGGAVGNLTGSPEHFHYREIDDISNEINTRVTFASGCCMLMPRSTIEKVGLMDEDYFLYVEDVDYCIKVIQAGLDIWYVPQAKLYHKVNASIGKLSNLGQYYTVRNKYMLIKRNFDGIKKFIAYTYLSLQNVCRCVRRKYKFRIVIKGTSAFLNNEMGKTDDFNI